jgi:hypothetical protein
MEANTKRFLNDKLDEAQMYIGFVFNEFHDDPNNRVIAGEVSDVIAKLEWIRNLIHKIKEV